MTRTKKALIAVLSVMCLVCIAMFTFTACSKKELKKDLKITNEPTKTNYLEGEKFDPAGLEVAAVYSNDSEKVLKDTDWTYDLTEPLKLTDKYVTITYEEKGGAKATAKQPITVHNDVTELTVKTEATQKGYAVGETFNPAGMVLHAKYETGKEEDVTVVGSSATYSQDPLTANDTTVTVEFGGKTVTQSIEFANGLKIKTAPTKVLYISGEKFAPDGMVLTLSFPTEADRDVIVKGSIAKYKTTILRTTDTDIEVTYGAHNVVQVIEFAPGVFIEAEDGLLNGGRPNLSSTSGGGNLGLDADEEKAAAGAQALYEAHLKAVFKASLSPDDKEADQKLANYVAGDEYKAKVQAYLDGENDDITDWDFEADVEHYTASGVGYLGGVNQGDVVSFVFNSPNAGKGNIAFRLASSWLWADNGNWTPSEMSDVQFNKLCEFYVNGVKYDIPDSVVLEGGKTEDGSFCQILWVNWKEVPFEGIDFVAGRNDIELKILHHGLVSPAQQSYNFAANIDSLIVTSIECEVEPCELIFNDYGYTAKEVNLVQEGDDVFFVLNGEFAEDAWSGYRPDELAKLFYFDFQNNKGWARNSLINNRELIIDGDNFTLKVNVTELAVTGGAWLAHFGWKEGKAGSAASNETVLDLKVEDTITYPEEEVKYYANYKNFLFAPTGDGDSEWGCVAIRISTDASIDEYTANDVKLVKETVEDNEVIYLQITGTAAWTKYAAADVAEYLASAYNFDLQNVASGNKTSNYNRTATVTNVTAGENDTFTGDYTIKINVTSLGAANYAMHLADWSTTNNEGKTIDGKDLGTLSNFDWLATSKVDTATTFTIGAICYSLSYDPDYSLRNGQEVANDENARKEHNYGCVAIIVENILSFEGKSVALAKENDKAIYTISGTYSIKEGATMTEDLIKEKIVAAGADFQMNPTAWGEGSSWTTKKLSTTVADVTIDTANKTFTVKYDVTDLSVYKYTGHFNGGDLKPAEAYESEVITIGSKTYQLVVVPGATSGVSYWGCPGLIVLNAE